VVIARGEEIEFGRYYSEEEGNSTAITPTKYIQEDVGSGPTKDE
jgi:hypothetical protein